jgi:hypothetical protein
MAIAALIALVHDVLLTIGVYSILGIEVTPATVIGVLTILGYSLYDTVVVFDKVRENTAGLVGNARMTYSQAANLAVNQTLVRSINTSVVACCRFWRSWLGPWASWAQERSKSWVLLSSSVSRPVPIAPSSLRRRSWLT